MKMYLTHRVNPGKWIMLLVLVISSAFSVRPVSAGSISVTSFLDVVADEGVCTLREAINSANQDSPSGSQPGECPAGSGADEIDLPAGTYTLWTRSRLRLMPGIGTFVTVYPSTTKTRAAYPVPRASGATLAPSNWCRQCRSFCR